MKMLQNSEVLSSDAGGEQKIIQNELLSKWFHPSTDQLVFAYFFYHKFHRKKTCV